MQIKENPSNEQYYKTQIPDQKIIQQKTKSSISKLRLHAQRLNADADATNLTHAYVHTLCLSREEREREAATKNATKVREKVP